MLLPTVREPTLSWHSVGIELRPDEVSASWDRDFLTPVSEAEVLARLRNRVSKHFNLGGADVFAPPAFGPGMGLCVENAEAVFRNVKLVPLNP